MQQFDKINLPLALDKSIGEKLLWRGRAGRGIIFRPADLLITPLTLLFFILVLFWQYRLEQLGMPQGLKIVNAFMLVAAILVTFVRFFWDAFIRARTDYVITSHRVIVQRFFWRQRINEFALKDITHLQSYGAGQGRLTIEFNPEPAIGMMNRHRRLRIKSSFGFRGLEAIEDGEKVMALLQKYMKIRSRR